MLIKIKLNTEKSGIVLLSALTRAHIFISTYKFKANDILLDAYLKKNFNMSLQKACLDIVDNLKLDLSDKYLAKLYLTDDNLDKIFRLICFGTGLIGGSSILKEALNIEKGVL